MRRRGVENARSGLAHAVDERRRLARRGVRQAQDDEVDGGEEIALRRRVLAALGGDALHGDAVDGAEALADAEPGRAGLAVDEDGLGGGARLLRFQGLGRGQHGGSPRD